MRYEVYEQDYDKVVSQKVKRYYTQNRKEAFRFMDMKNREYHKNIWRVAMCISDRICFDIDIGDIDNLNRIYNYYSELFSTEFDIISTLNGYHLISKKKYTESILWQYDTCRVLNPSLELNKLQNYIEDVVHEAKSILHNQKAQNVNRTTFLDFYNEELRTSRVFTGIGIFDMYFCTNVIVRGFYCIRISKKASNDIPVRLNNAYPNTIFC